MERDVASCETLEDAIDLLTVEHVKAGWCVREETVRENRVTVVTVWITEVVNGRIGVRLDDSNDTEIYVPKPEHFTPRKPSRHYQLFIYPQEGKRFLDAWERNCPTCKAEPKQPCVSLAQNGSGKAIQIIHAERRNGEKPGDRAETGSDLRGVQEDTLPRGGEMRGV